MKRKHLHAVILVVSFLLAGIQPALAVTWVLPPPEGETYPFGTWDPETSTFTLTQNPDVGDSLKIGKNGLTLDGDGHTVEGPYPPSGSGVHIPLRTGVTIKNIRVQNFNFGIWLNSSTDNELTGNTASGNNHGICLISANYNKVTGNTASNNNSDGIYLNHSSGNVLSRNTASNNKRYGIYLKEGSSNNTIYNNNFIDNATQANVSDSTGNVFNLDKPIGGNYWSDWTGEDTGGDGIGETAYTFTSGQDNLPWTVQDGWLVPLNQPPIADAGPDQSVECKCQTEQGTQVTLDGTGSSDPDGDPLTYQWTGPFVEDGGTASGATPTVTLDGCMDSCVISLVVNDGQVDSEEDTVTITVVDTTPPDMTPPGDTTVEAMGPDGVPVDDDEVQTFLDGASADDDCTPTEQIIITNNAPDVFFPGDTLVTFTAADESGNTATCESTVTVVEAAKSHLRIVPRIINREGRLRKISAVIRFPEGTTGDDVDMDVPLVLFPGDSPYGIDATRQRIVTRCRWRTLRVSVFACFSKDEVTAAIPEDGPVEFMVVGRFVDGQYFYGTRTVRIISWDWKRW